MALSIKAIKREFIINDKSCPDPNPELSVKEVMDLYSNQFPELNNATVSGPELKKDKQVFTFVTKLGDKG